MQRTGGLLGFMEWRKTMVVDFRKTRTTLCCVSILGEEVEVVERHKYSYFKSYCYFRQLASWLPRHQQTTVVPIVGLMY